MFLILGCKDTVFQSDTEILDEFFFKKDQFKQYLVVWERRY